MKRSKKKSRERSSETRYVHPTREELRRACESAAIILGLDDMGPVTPWNSDGKSILLGSLDGETHVLPTAIDGAGVPGYMTRSEAWAFMRGIEFGHNWKALKRDR